MCRFKNQYCRVCKNKGHISTVCKKNIPAEQNVKVVDHTVGETISSDQVDETVEFELYKMNTDSQAPPVLLPMKLNDSNIYLGLDTGASVTVISEQSWKETLKSVPLQATNVVLKTYSGERLDVLGKASVTVEYKNQVAGLLVYVSKGEGPNLMGRNWLGHINLDWGYIKKVSTALDDVLSKHAKVVEEGLGTMKGVEAKLSLKEGSKPKFCKPRSVPFALREVIERDLDRLEGMGVLEKVNHSKWASPIVPVVKSDNSICICGDYKVTVNNMLNVDQFPFPTLKNYL